MKILLMADNLVGLKISKWLFKYYSNDLALVVTLSENDIFHAAKKIEKPCLMYSNTEDIVLFLEKNSIQIDLGILAWWPYIIKKPLLTIPVHGFINTHPSLLPNNRGKHYNFWSIVERAPFGVTLHFIDEGIDTGDIVFQKEIPCTWEDNGESLYKKAQNYMVNLFKESYPKIRVLNLAPKKQDKTKGSFHKKIELEDASIISLDKKYVARDLINLLRARTFSGLPSCRFKDDGVEYEVRINIKRKVQ